MSDKYGYKHRQMRARWKRQVEAGVVLCARCGLPIEATDSWDLGHSDLVPGEHSGPEHRRCNRATLTHAKQRAAEVPRWSRKW